jgi:hypothetical protein
MKELERMLVVLRSLMLCEERDMNIDWWGETRDGGVYYGKGGKRYRVRIEEWPEE